MTFVTITIPWFLIQACAFTAPPCERPEFVWQPSQAVCERTRQKRPDPEAWRCSIDVPAWVSRQVQKEMRE